VTAGRTEDLALLRRFEPQLRLTLGEQFSPQSIEAYLSLSDLVVRRPGEEPEVVVRAPELDQQKLASWASGPFGAISYLQLVRRPLTALELVKYRSQSTLRHFHWGTRRRARVGMGGRLFDAGFRLSFLARGRVPGGFAGAAAVMVQEAVAGRRPVCYGRVVRTPSYTALQYHFFYAYNDYRSHFHGANDHEGDWELVTVYLSEDPEKGPMPEWVAYASHEARGSDVRRRWDDPELRRVGEHPVVYVGAGSHASYFAPGDYLIRIELRALARLRESVDALRVAWRRLLRQGGLRSTGGRDRRFAVAFVDYARGDGPVMGPATDQGFDLRLAEEQPALLEYAGLWGRYSQDFFRGEDAPAGPRFEADGGIRLSWYDPVGWASLHGIPPSTREVELVAEELAQLAVDRAATGEAIERAGREAEGLGVRSATLELRGAPAKERADLELEFEEAARRVQALRFELNEQDRLTTALEARRTRLLLGEREDPRAHLRHPAVPEKTAGPRLRRLAETWSALSAGLLLLAGAGVAGVYRTAPLPLLLLAGTFLFLESLFSRRVVVLVHALVTTLAVITLLLLVWQFWWQTAVSVAAVLGVFLIWSNVSELRGR
jgi:hypothetical protein